MPGRDADGRPVTSVLQPVLVDGRLTRARPGPRLDAHTELSCVNWPTTLTPSRLRAGQVTTAEQHDNEFIALNVHALPADVD